MRDNVRTNESNKPIKIDRSKSYSYGNVVTTCVFVFSVSLKPMSATNSASSIADNLIRYEGMEFMVIVKVRDAKIALDDHF